MGWSFPCNRGACENPHAQQQWIYRSAAWAVCLGIRKTRPAGTGYHFEMKSAAPGFPRAPPQSCSECHRALAAISIQSHPTL